MPIFTLVLPPNALQARHDSEWVRQADAALVSGGIALVLKRSVRSERPNGSSSDGFPSFHTTIAFSLATVRSSLHPKEAIIWYPAAALVGEWRVNAREHTVLQAVAGAALGYAVARWELSRRNGLIIFPLAGSRQFGLLVSQRF